MQKSTESIADILKDKIHSTSESELKYVISPMLYQCILFCEDLLKQPDHYIRNHSIHYNAQINRFINMMKNPEVSFPVHPMYESIVSGKYHNGRHDSSVTAMRDYCSFLYEYSNDIYREIPWHCRVVLFPFSYKVIPNPILLVSGVSATFIFFTSYILLNVIY